MEEDMVLDDTLDIEETGESSEQTPSDVVSKSEYDKALELAENYKKRAEKAESKTKQTPKGTSSEEVEFLKTELAKTQLIAKGYNDQEIEVVSRVAKELGISPLEASSKKYVQAEINEMRTEQKVKEATPSQSGRSGGVKKDMDYYIDKDELPEDPEMIRAIIAKKAGRTYKPLG